TVPFGEPLTHVIPVTKQPVLRQKTVQFVPSNPRRQIATGGWGSFGGVVTTAEQQVLGVGSTDDTNMNLSNVGQSLNTMDTAAFSGDIFDWAMGLGSTPMDASNQ